MEDKKFRYSVSSISFNKKLPKVEFWKVNRSMTSTESTIREFAGKVGNPNSHSWSGGVFSNGTIDNKNWIGSEIVGLDFDSGKQSVEEIYKIFMDNGICPNVNYNTFGSSPSTHKFRVVLFFDKPITDQKVYNKIMETLGKLLVIDNNCKNCSRIFYGGNDVKITNHSPIVLDQFLDFINLTIVSNDKGLTRSIIPCETNCANFRSSVYYNNTDHPFLAVQTYTLLPTSIEGGQNIDWEIARERIKIWDEFLNGKWLQQNELFGLATNLIYVKGGIKKNKETMEFYNALGITNYTKNNFSVMPYVKKRRYFPVPIYTFSPYKEDAEVYDFISEVTNKRGHITILEPKKKVSQEVAEKRFKEKFNDVVKAGDLNKTCLILVPTAMGKTELLTKVEMTTCALPTNDLKNEVKERMTVDHTITPNTIQFSDKNLQRRIDNFYKVGLPKKSMELIHSVAEDRDGFSKNDILIATQYLDQLTICNNKTISQLTTHKRLLNSDDILHQTVMFDEDPLATLVEIQNTKITELSKLYCMHEPIKEVVDYLNSLEDGIYDLPCFKLDISDLIKNCYDIREINSNVFDFFNCKHFIWDKGNIHYILKKELPTDTKNVIMSATLSPYIYQKLYPTIEFDVFNIRNVEQKGKVIQYTGRSCSRSSLSRYYNEIVEEVGQKIVITFKDYRGLFKNADERAYFGNCSGYDHLNGKDIVVVGTPHRSMTQYFLLAKLMGVCFDIKNSTMNYQKVRYNGYEFMFNCFDNEELRTIQLSLIESDLVQAVGRARTLRNNNTVEVYSNFPLDITDEFYIKKPKKS